MQASADPVFTPVAVGEHIYDGGWEHFVGGGLAVFDCNGDQLPELFAAGGSNPAALFVNHSTRDAVAFELRTPDSLALTHVTGAYPIEIDGDGITDLVILRVGANLLLQGQGNCTFTPFETLALADDNRWSTAFSATWETGASLPTLAIGNYVDRENPNGPFEACDQNDLYRPKGAVYPPPAPLTPGFCALSMLFSDWGRNGRADLRVSNDRHYYVRGGAEQLWAMEDTPRLFTDQDGWQNYAIWGMGIGSRDITGDGLPEVYLTSMADQKLQTLATSDRPVFADFPFDAGATAHRPYTGGDGRPSTGWHVAFGDVQNDGLDDIFVSKGNVEQMPGSAMDDPNNLLLQGKDGVFSEAGDTAGVASMARGRGATLSDFNGDGLLDIAVVNRRAALEIYQNTTEASGHWISISLNQPAPNTDAIGAWIELDLDGRIVARERTIGGGHAGGALVPEHFGLGDVQSVKLRVIWPDGTASDWQRLDAGQHWHVTREGNHTTATRY